MFSRVMGVDMVLDSFARARFSQDHARHTLHEVVRSGKSRRHYPLLNDPSEVTNSPWIIWCTPVPWPTRHEVKLSRADDPPRHHEVSIGCRS